MKLWDGLTQQRRDLGTVKAAGHDDYLIIVAKIQELQQFVLNFTNNIEVMPDLAGTLKAAQEQIIAVHALIDEISLPQDVKDRLDLLEQLINEIDQRAGVTFIKRELDSLKEKIAKNQLEVLHLQSSFATDVKGFQNKVWGILEKLQKETVSKVDDLAEKLERLEVQLELQATVEKLNQLKSK